MTGGENRRRGQGTFEYVLLLGGVLLIVVLALFVLQSNFFQSASNVSDVQIKQCKLAASQTNTCFNNAAFDGTNTFHMLGYPDLLYCNCSNFNPGEFSASVGQTPWPSLDFYTPASQTPYSPLYFDAAPTPPVGTYAFSITLPAGTYHFYLETGNSLTQLEPDTTATVSNGRQAYSWTNLPTASKIQIIPTKTLTQDQRDTALQQKEQTPSADEQEKPEFALERIDKPIDAANGFKLIHGSDGKNRATYTYTPTQDYTDTFTLTLPIASDEIEKTYPTTSAITPNADDPTLTDLTWTQIQLHAGQPFPILIQFKNGNDLQTLSAETDGKLKKWAGKSFTKTKPRCPALLGITLPIGCTNLGNANPTPNPTTQCPTIPLTTIQIPFGCIGPTPTPSLTPPSENPSASPNPKCVAADQGCGLLPGSTACCTGSTCGFQGISTVCITSAPTASPTPSSRPKIDLSRYPIVTAEPWVFYDASPTPTPSPSPSPDWTSRPTASPQVLAQGDECDPADSTLGACGNGLQCIAVDVQSPSTSDYTCQAKQAPAPTPTPVADASSGSVSALGASLTKSELPSFNLKGNLKNFKAVSLTRDDSGNLYLLYSADKEDPGHSFIAQGSFAYQVQKLGDFQQGDQTLFPITQGVHMKTFSELQRVYGVAVSKDNGKTWSDVSGSITNVPKNTESVSNGGYSYHQPQIYDFNSLYPNTTCEQSLSDYFDSHPDQKKWLYQNGQGYTFSQMRTVFDSGDGGFKAVAEGHQNDVGNYVTITLSGNRLPSKMCLFNIPAVNPDAPDNGYLGSYEGPITDTKGNYVGPIGASMNVTSSGLDESYLAMDANYIRFWNPSISGFDQVKVYTPDGTSEKKFTVNGVQSSNYYLWNYDHSHPVSSSYIDQFDESVGTFSTVEFYGRLITMTVGSNTNGWCYPLHLPSNAGEPMTISFYVPSPGNFWAPFGTCATRTRQWKSNPSKSTCPYTDPRVTNANQNPNMCPYPIWSFPAAVFDVGYGANANSNFVLPFESYEPQISLPTLHATHSVVYPMGTVPMKKGIVEYYSVETIDETQDYSGVTAAPYLQTQATLAKPHANYHVEQHAMKITPDGVTDQVIGVKTSSSDLSSFYYPSASEDTFGYSQPQIQKSSNGIAYFGGGSFSKDGGPIVTDPSVPTNFDLVSPDGSFYSWKYDSSTQLTTIYKYVSGSWVATSVRLPSSFSCGNSVFDPHGNLHCMNGGSAIYSGTNKFPLKYGFIPHAALDPAFAPPVQTVYLLTNPNCAVCDLEKSWLTKNSVNYLENPTVMTPDVKAQVDATQSKNQFPATVIQLKSGQFQTISGYDWLSLANALGLPSDYQTLANEAFTVTNSPLKYNTYDDGWRTYWQTYSYPLRLSQLVPNSDGTPALVSSSDEGVRVFSYSNGQWQIKNLGPLMSYYGSNQTLNVRNTPPMLAVSNQYSLSNLVLLQATAEDFSDQTTGTDAEDKHRTMIDFQGSVDYQYDAASGFAGLLKRPDLNNNADYKAYVYASSYGPAEIVTKYDAYSFTGQSGPGPDPVDQLALSELVPYQHFSKVIPMAVSSAPTVSGDYSGPVSFTSKVVPDPDDSTAFDADLTVDARSLLKGGVLDIPDSTVSSKLTAKADGNSVDMPVSLAVQHVPVENLAYAAPKDTVFYYDSNGKTVSGKKLFLVNNLPNAAVFACGSVFSQSVPAHSISTVDLAPVAATMTCALALDGVATKETMDFERKDLDVQQSWATQDVLANSVPDDGSSPISYKDCANGYCNCQQALNALDDFSNQVEYHAELANAEGYGTTLSELYPNGLNEKTVLRTGTFYDLGDGRLGTCQAELGGYEYDLQPGQVYQVGLNVPQAASQLFTEKEYPDRPVPLIPQWSIATSGGVVSDSTAFPQMSEVR